MNKLKRCLQRHKEACWWAVVNFEYAEIESDEDVAHCRVVAAQSWLDEAAQWAMRVMFEAKPAHQKTLINLLKARYLKAINQRRFGKWVAV